MGGCQWQPRAGELGERRVPRSEAGLMGRGAGLGVPQERCRRRFVSEVAAVGL